MKFILKKLNYFLSIILSLKNFKSVNKKIDLLIFDDIFPHPSSGFRLEEFKVLLSEFENSQILINGEAYGVLKTDIKMFPLHIDDFLNFNKRFFGKLILFNSLEQINSKLFYCVFLSNIYRFIEVLEKNKINFVFTLYPGGGFRLFNDESDKMLIRVMGSDFFKKVIVTQKVTLNYLIENQFCDIDKINFIQGVVVPQNSITSNLNGKKYFSFNKSSLDLCFFGAKYMPKGLDKGYDIFIEVAHILSKYDFIRFHVIGGFDADDIDISKIQTKIKFYGYQEYKNLSNIFDTIDILISPNRPNKVDEGAFDGFPLGTVIEAALNGVLILTSDPMEQNTFFNNYDDLYIVEPSSESIIERVEYLISNPSLIKKNALTGRIKFQEHFSNSKQMNKRISTLKQFL